MPTPKVEKPKGILNPQESQRNFSLSRYFPAEDLAFFVEHLWVTRWDLRGQAPYLTEILSYPAVNLVIEEGESAIFGVVTGKFTRLLKDKGWAFAIRFRPGAFYPFIQAPVSKLTDSQISLCDAFGADGEMLARTLLSTEGDDAMIEVAEHFLRGRLPQRDQTVELVNQVIDRIREHHDITKVDDIVAQLGFNKRTLQRVFHRYVGVSPKWVIQRYRLQEAADQLASGSVVDLARTAADLGYFDQAHFIKDFKAIVGKSPAKYAKQADIPNSVGES